MPGTDGGKMGRLYDDGDTEEASRICQSLAMPASTLMYGLTVAVGTAAGEC